MEPGRRRPRRAAAVVGLVAGLALLFGAVLDGGLATPTRTDGAAAVPHGDLGHAPTAQPREDRAAWDHPLPPSSVALLLAALVALAASAVLITPAPAVGSSRRAPALLAARHRGPPVLV